MAESLRVGQTLQLKATAGYQSPEEIFLTSSLRKVMTMMSVVHRLAMEETSFRKISLTVCGMQGEKTGTANVPEGVWLAKYVVDPKAEQDMYEGLKRFIKENKAAVPKYSHVSYRPNLPLTHLEHVYESLEHIYRTDVSELITEPTMASVIMSTQDVVQMQTVRHMFQQKDAVLLLPTSDPQFSVLSAAALQAVHDGKRAGFSSKSFLQHYQKFKDTWTKAVCDKAQAGQEKPAKKALEGQNATGTQAQLEEGGQDNAQQRGHGALGHLADGRKGETSKKCDDQAQGKGPRNQEGEKKKMTQKPVIQSCIRTQSTPMEEVTMEDTQGRPVTPGRTPPRQSNIGNLQNEDKSRKRKRESSSSSSPQKKKRTSTKTADTESGRIAKEHDKTEPKSNLKDGALVGRLPKAQDAPPNFGLDEFDTGDESDDTDAVEDDFQRDDLRGLPKDILQRTHEQLCDRALLSSFMYKYTNRNTRLYLNRDQDKRVKERQQAILIQRGIKPLKKTPPIMKMNTHLHFMCSMFKVDLGEIQKLHPLILATLAGNNGKHYSEKLLSELTDISYD